MGFEIFSIFNLPEDENDNHNDDGKNAPEDDMGK